MSNFEATLGHSWGLVGATLGASYLLDPELPSGGRRLQLLSNLPRGAHWSSPTLSIDGNAVRLVPGRHEITLTDSETGLTVSQDIVVESL